MAESAERIFTDAMFRWVEGILVCRNFRLVAMAGVPIGERAAFQQTMEVAKNNPQMVRLLQHSNSSVTRDKQADFAGKMADNFGEYITVAINAASLVFVCAMLDGVANDYLRCSAIANARDWKPVLVNKTLSDALFDGLSEV